MDSRTKRFELRLNAHEKEVLKERAAKAGVSVSDLVRLALVYSDRLTVRTIDISPLRDPVSYTHLGSTPSGHPTARTSPS